MIVDFDREYSFLSNFYDSPFVHEGITYPTNEHFFQAMKTLDQEERKKIAAAATPGQSKRLGRHVALRPDWEAIKLDVMKEGLALKFADPKLREKLLATGDEILVEGNWWHDNTWGSCHCPLCDKIPGKNLLGKALMELRTNLHKD